MGLFDKVRTAEIYERGQYLPAPGQFLLKVTECKRIDTRKDGEAFIATHEVVESNRDDVKIGQKADHFCGTAGEAGEYFGRKVGEWLLALFGLVPGKRDAEAVKALLDR